MAEDTFEGDSFVGGVEVCYRAIRLATIQGPLNIRLE